MVPCYLTGAPNDGTSFGAFFTPARAELRIGVPIDISEFYGRDHDKEVLGELTRRFLRRDRPAGRRRGLRTGIGGSPLADGR